MREEPTPNLFIGTAGWSLRSEQTALFPSTGTHLQRYARVFNSVEINSSFYRAHQHKTYVRWAESVPDGFRFSVKIPKRMTHELKLKDCQPLISEFLSQVCGLGKKLGCVLVQLPPKLSFEEEVAKRFFGDLRKQYDGKIALEPRHVSWFLDRPAEFLTEKYISYVNADPTLWAHVPRIEAFCYLRLHGSPKIYYSNYEEETLRFFMKYLREARKSNQDAWCIFDNTALGYATHNALSMQKLVSAKNSRASRVITEAQKHLRAADDRVGPQRQNSSYP